tara:strand:+ start:1347 stop:2246 length:900 start_codon:yes stop_codon:yes gene_type:complete
MTKSRPNDNGRYFEFLLTDFLVNEFKISLTERAKIDQERDKEKVVDSKVLKKMNDSVIKIKNWLEKQVELNSECILDRLPDKDVNQSTHADISIIGSKKISFSLKHNHDGIFHGRIGACSNWPGIDKQSSLTTKFEKNKKNLYLDIQKKIPIGTKFADKGIYEEYREEWSKFVYELHELARNFLNKACKDTHKTRNLFNTILGSGSDEFRILQKNSKVIVQDLRNLSLPNKVKIDNVQNLSDKDPRSSYVWHLVFCFDNGIKIDARNKQDSGTMATTPKLKLDWQVIDWGNSGMIEKIL